MLMEKKYYKACYTLKVDEDLGNGDFTERKFKLAEDKTVIINTLKDLQAYTKIDITFKITFYTNSIGIEVVDVDL